MTEYDEGVIAGQQSVFRALSRGGVAVSRKMVEAAQHAYESNPEYGLTDKDMQKAIAAAIQHLGTKKGK